MLRKRRVFTAAPLFSAARARALGVAKYENNKIRLKMAASKAWHRRKQLCYISSRRNAS